MCTSLNSLLNSIQTKAFGNFIQIVSISFQFDRLRQTDRTKRSSLIQLQLTRLMHACTFAQIACAFTQNNNKSVSPRFCVLHIWTTLNIVIRFMKCNRSIAMRRNRKEDREKVLLLSHHKYLTRTTTCNIGLILGFAIHCHAHLFYAIIGGFKFRICKSRACIKRSKEKEKTNKQHVAVSSFFHNLQGASAVADATVAIVNLKRRRWKNIGRSWQWKAMSKATGEVQITIKAFESCTFEILHKTLWIVQKRLNAIQISAWIFSNIFFWFVMRLQFWHLFF